MQQAYDSFMHEYRDCRCWNQDQSVEELRGLASVCEGLRPCIKTENRETIGSVKGRGGVASQRREGDR